MDSFEEIAAKYLEEKHYWVRQCVRADISKEEKREVIKKPSMPAPVLDIVALKLDKNELLLVEVKSFLNSPGVRFSGVTGKNKKDASRYKLFTQKKYREVVTNHIKEEYLKYGLINKNTKIKYALLAGNIYSTKHSEDETDIRKYFEEKGWILFPPKDIKEKIKNLSETQWEDNVVTMTAKLTKEAYFIDVKR